MADETQAYSGPIVTRADAKAAGLKWFFTGKPCKRGHISERWANYGACLRCQKIANAKSYADDPSASMARARKWEAENPDRAKEHSSRNYRKNFQKAKADSARRYAANKDGARAYIAQWQRENRVRVDASKAKWRRKNSDSIRLWVVARRAMKRGAEGHYTVDDIASIKKAQKGRCGYCRVSLASGYHVDHIQALSRGGSNWPRNLQLLCGPCNSKKNAKDPVTFAQQLGLLC